MMMTKKWFATPVMALVINLVSCDKITENYHDQQAQSQYTSPYKGTYKGVFTGTEVGSLSLEVAKSGAITAGRKIDNTDYSETFYGNAYDSGVLFSVFSQTSGFTLMGTLSSRDKNAKGTWKMGAQQGNWSLTKQ